ncbi:MAG: hypothetical protein H7Y62_12580 [Hyphomicrobium sp.]|nr:hypothetical protein [Hyphomicrobium sp.]
MLILIIATASSIVITIHEIESDEAEVASDWLQRAPCFAKKGAGENFRIDHDPAGFARHVRPLLW